MRRRRNGGGLIIGLSTSNMMSVGLPGISGAPVTTHYAYVANSNISNSSVSVIEISTNKVITTIAVESQSEPVWVAITPDGNYAYVTDFTGSISTVSVIEITETELLLILLFATYA